MAKILVDGSRYTVCENHKTKFGVRGKSVLAGGRVRDVASVNGRWEFIEQRVFVRG